MSGTVVTVGVIAFKNEKGEKVGCFDVCRDDTGVVCRINRNGNEVVFSVKPDVARTIGHLFMQAGNASDPGRAPDPFVDAAERAALGIG